MLSEVSTFALAFSLQFATPANNHIENGGESE